ncbi:MAG: polysaccharide deacetylase family protein [Syntrophomonadaceae bacterium]|nr:polysaccharide deacetylase family protein [Syntrophomonadaceae bacterium]
MFIIIRRRRLLLFMGIMALALLCVGGLKVASNAQLQAWYREGILVRGIDTEEKVVALTFDDGPDPQGTPAVLSALAKHDIKATFFVMGKRAKEYPKLLLGVAAAGHELGNHSYQHNYYNHYDYEFIREDINRTQSLLNELTGEAPALLRAPGGNLTNDVIKAARELELMLVNWGSDSRDWENGKSAESIAAHVLDHVGPGQIILLHDGCPNSLHTAAALDTIITALTAQGYRFVTVSELLALATPEPVSSDARPGVAPAAAGINKADAE